MIYTKKFANLDEQVEILINRNLNIKNHTYAKDELLAKNYFDLINGFESLFFDALGTKKDYKKVYSFDSFIDLMKFEKTLSSKVFMVLDEFENKLKTAVAFRVSEKLSGLNNNPRSYLNILNYDNPVSIYNRVERANLMNTISESEIKKIDSYIQKINASLNKFNSNYRFNNNRMVNFKKNSTRIKFKTLEDKIKNALISLNSVINETNQLITNSALTHSGGVSLTQLNNTTPVTFSLNIVQQTSRVNLNQFNDEVEKNLNDLEKFYMRINAFNSSIAENPNLAIHTVPEYLLWNLSDHYLFRTNHSFGDEKFLDYIEFCKKKEKYISTYKIPPFWVIIKTLDYGSLLSLIYSLKRDLLNNVLEDLGYPKNKKEAFFNSLEIIRIFRNNCAHFQLMNRFRTPSNLKINKDLISMLNLTTKNNGSADYEIRLFDTLLVLGQFVNLNSISQEFNNFFITNPSAHLDNNLFKEFLKRMGNANINSWINL